MWNILVCITLRRTHFVLVRWRDVGKTAVLFGLRPARFLFGLLNVFEIVKT